MAARAQSASSRDAAHSVDDHYLVIDGRRWRQSDPGIPESLRSELVHELMDARRAVRAAKLAASALQEKAARARVQDAKLALGERGEPYWQAPNEGAQRKRAVATIRTLLARRTRKRDAPTSVSTICPSDVARVIGGKHWAGCMQLVREVAAQLVTRGQLRVLQRGREVSIESVRGPIRFALA